MSEASHELTKEKIDDAIGLCKSYAKTRRSQMQRGLNDFNVFTCLLSESDEVRLHSRFIHSLLDINGAHGQGDFFLGLFLKECKLDKLDDDEGMDLKNCRVHKEYNNIDLYMTDGSRHIIIENKIYAGPQDRQIERYIETIKEENPDDYDLSKNLVVVYLSLDRDGPHKDSLGKYEIVKNETGKEIVNKAKEVESKFLSIHYDQEILGWIQSCKTQVSNITNLSIGLTQYEEVILSLYGRKEDKLMNLKKYIEENHKGNELDVLRDLRKVNQEYTSLREDYIRKVFHKSAELIKKEIPKGWKVELKELEEVYSRGNDMTALRITQSELEKPALAFRFMFEKDYQYPQFGVGRASKTVDLAWLENDDAMKDELDKIKIGQKLRCCDLPWWPAYETYHEGDTFDFIIDRGGVDKTATTIAEKFLCMFRNYKEYVKKCDELYLSRPEQS